MPQLSLLDRFPSARDLSLQGGHSGAAHAAPTLQESSLTLKNRQRILQAADLGFSSRLSSFIRLRLCNAPLLDLTVVLQNCGKLGVGCVFVRRKFRDCLV